MNTKTITDAEILKNVIEKLRINANRMARDCEYKSKASIYHVLNGINNITDDMISRIMKAYPEVSYIYLKKGEGSITLTDSQIQNQKNLLQGSNKEKLSSLDIIDRISKSISLNHYQMQSTLNETNKLLKDILVELKKSK